MTSAVREFRIVYYRSKPGEPVEDRIAFFFDEHIAIGLSWGDIKLDVDVVKNADPQKLQEALRIVANIEPFTTATFMIMLLAKWDIRHVWIAHKAVLDQNYQYALKARRQDYIELSPKEQMLCELIIDEQIKRESRPGYVYLIKSASGFYKIGRTKDPSDRIKTFSVKLPFEVEYDHLIETGDMCTLEQNLHDHFANQRVNGEWFSLTPEHVDFIKSIKRGMEHD